MIKFYDKRITTGRPGEVWHVTGIVKHGEVRLDGIAGDITNVAGIREAVRQLVLSKPRYQRYVSP